MVTRAQRKDLQLDMPLLFMCLGLMIHDDCSKSHESFFEGVSIYSLTTSLESPNRRNVHSWKEFILRVFWTLPFSCVTWEFYVEEVVWDVEFSLKNDLCYAELNCDQIAQKCPYSLLVLKTLYQGYHSERQSWFKQQPFLQILVFGGSCWRCSWEESFVNLDTGNQWTNADVQLYTQ